MCGLDSLTIGGFDMDWRMSVVRGAMMSSKEMAGCTSVDYGHVWLVNGMWTTM